MRLRLRGFDVTSNFPPDKFIEVKSASDPPTISILMPIFQQKWLVEKAIRSVLAQRSVVAEIIISDDASNDETFQRAHACVSAAVSEGKLPHRVFLRRGTNRLRRDHLLLLSDHASCDMVMQAHGDDVSYPWRAHSLVDIFCATRAVVIGSLFNAMDASKTKIDESRVEPTSVSIKVLSQEEVINGLEHLIGSSQAWKRSALSIFDRLESRVAPVSHDRILPFRGSLVGKVVMVLDPLFDRGIHAGNFSNILVDYCSQESRTFGFMLYGLNRMRTMYRDVIRACEAGYIDQASRIKLLEFLDVKAKQMEDEMHGAFAKLVVSGLQIKWVPEDALRPPTTTLL